MARTRKDKMKAQVEASHQENRNYKDIIIKDSVKSGRARTESEARETIDDLINDGSVYEDPLTGEIC